MQYAQQMIETHPRPLQFDRAALLECIEACYDCAQVCTSCADACLGEPQVQMLVRCIRLNLDCADVCETTGRVITRQTDPDTEVLQAQLRACAQACRACAEECAKHAEHHEHCGEVQSADRLRSS